MIGAFPNTPKATLVAGYQMVLSIPRQQLSVGQRYLGLNYVVNTANFSAGAFSATVLKDVGDHRKIYPKAYTIS